MDPLTLLRHWQHMRYQGDQEAEQEQHRRRWLQLSETWKGSYRLEGELDSEGGSVLKTALQGLMKAQPRDDPLSNWRLSGRTLNLCKPARSKRWPGLSILLGLPAIVEVVGATCRFGEIVALDDVHLALRLGELAFVVGPSGAGKTTLLKLINREIRPTSGEVWIDGHAAHALRPSKVARLRRRVGVVYQDYKLLPRLTALENVAFALQVCELGVSDDEAHDRALDALEAVGLGGREGAFPSELSGGQQQRVAIARSVVAQPPVLIADEPTGNLDLETAWQVMKLLEQISRFGTTVLIATHNLDIVRRMQRRVVTLVEGRLVRDQPAGRVGRLAWAAS